MSFPLSAAQEEAAGFLYGRLAITAGPGSGKTATVVERIRRLLDVTTPDEIVALTFTNKAANELEQRLARRLGFVGTIHGFAYFILQAYPECDHALGHRFGILSGFDRRDLIQKAINDTASTLSVGFVDDALSALHRAGQEPKGPVPANVDRAFDLERVRLAYEATKSRYVVEDFDGLIDRARLILLANPIARQNVHDRVRHVSIDEAQDLDRAQADFLELVCPWESVLPLAFENCSLVLVGDPLQAVYGWRGGDPAILAEYAERAHRSVFLGVNYRSGSAIVAATNRLAEGSAVKPEGYVLEAHRTDLPGMVVVDPPCATDAIELDKLARSLEAFRKPEGDDRPLTSFSGAAVLARTNSTLERLALRLDARGIPYRLLGAKRAILRDPAVRGALAYIRLALNPADDHAFELALSTPPRPAMTKEAWRVLLAERQGGSLYAAAGRTAGRDRDKHPALSACLVGFLQRIGPLAVEDSEFTGSPFGWSGPIDDLIGFLIEHHVALGLMGRAAALAALRDLLGDFLSGRARGRVVSSIRGFLWFATFGQAQDELDEGADAVTLSTIHLAKGLEWPAVFLPCWNEDVLPSSQSQTAALEGDPGKLDEELRLAFVAISRAADVVMVSHALKRRIVEGGFDVPAAPSRFLLPLKPPPTL